MMGRMTEFAPGFLTRPSAGSAEYLELVEIWRSAVRATHDILDESDSERIEVSLVSGYFPAVSMLVAESSTPTPRRRDHRQGRFLSPMLPARQTWNPPRPLSHCVENQRLRGHEAAGPKRCAGTRSVKTLPGPRPAGR